jgi:hypothetical protein
MLIILNRKIHYKKKITIFFILKNINLTAFVRAIVERLIKKIGTTFAGLGLLSKAGKLFSFRK